MITVLLSGIGLGEYVPGLVVRNQLLRVGLEVETYSLEELYQPGLLSQRRQTQRAFQKDFRLARKATQMAAHVEDTLDPMRVGKLLAGWGDGARRRFIVFSGFWVPVLKAYLGRQGDNEVTIDAFHVDCGVGASWEMHLGDCPACRHIYLGDWKKRELLCQIRMSPVVKPWAERLDRCVAHGGGWGIGTYRDKCRELGLRNVPLDVVLNDLDWTTIPGHDYNQPDGTWQPQMRDRNGCHIFPPLYKLLGEKLIPCASAGGNPPLYSLIERAKGIVCKTGGGAIIDSLSAATPIIILDPYHKHEAHNGALWKERRFGISYEDWQSAGCPMDALEELHQNLVRARAETADYVTSVYGR